MKTTTELTIIGASLIEIPSYGSFLFGKKEPIFPLQGLQIQASGKIKGRPYKDFPDVYADLPISLNFCSFNPSNFDIKLGDKIKVTVGWSE